MNKRLLVLPLLVFVSLFAKAQFTVDVAVYNLLNFPSSQPDRTDHLAAIIDTLEPDIFMVCELDAQSGVNDILTQSLNTNGRTQYAAATWQPNQSTGGNLTQMLFYNQNLFTLDAQQVYTTDLRDINRYTLTAKTTDVGTDPLTLEVFVTHLKAGSGAQNPNNEARRLLEVQTFQAALTTIPPTSRVIFAGDFNLYSSSESAYQAILDSNNAIQMEDPIQTPGAWNSNSSFASIHTQSTFTNQTGNDHIQDSNGDGDGALGGMDSRFDFIMTSSNLLTDPTLQYVPGSYDAVGNNGNCYNDAVNDINCTGTWSQAFREELFNMSDHLPVVLQLSSNKILSIPEFTRSNVALEATLVNESIALTNLPAGNQSVRVFDVTGRELLVTDTNTLDAGALYVGELPSGLYYVRLGDVSSTLKFIKN